MLEQKTYQEEQLSNGPQDPDKLYYVIRRFFWHEGICSVINTIIGGIAQAQRLSASVTEQVVPVVDMLHYHSMFWQEDEQKNDWERYFLQPFGVGLEKLKGANKVLMSGEIENGLHLGYDFFDEDRIAYFHKICSQYLIPQKHILEEIQKKEKEIFKEGRKIIGCFARIQITAGKQLEQQLEKQRKETLDENRIDGWTMYRYPEQPTKEELLNILKHKMKEWSATHVFMSVDDEETIEFFQRELGEKLLYIPRKRFEIFHGESVDIDSFIDQPALLRTEDRNAIDSNLGYLLEIYMLSKCDSFVCGRSSGSLTAMVLNGGRYRHKLIFSEIYNCFEETELLEFAKKYQKLYIYGAGEYGRIIAYILRSNGINADSFIVSDDQKIEKPIMNYSVKHLSEITISEDAGIIVAIKYYTEVVNNLNRIGIQNFFVLDKNPGI